MSLRLNLKIKKNYNIEENQNCNFWMLEEIPEFEKLQLKMRWWNVIYRRVWDVIGIGFCTDWIRLKNVKYAYVL